VATIAMELALAARPAAAGAIATARQLAGSLPGGADPFSEALLRAAEGDMAGALCEPLDGKARTRLIWLVALVQAQSSRTADAIETAMQLTRSDAIDEKPILLAALAALPSSQPDHLPLLAVGRALGVEDRSAGWAISAEQAALVGSG
jgi:hypothetical protein